MLYDGKLRARANGAEPRRNHVSAEPHGVAQTFVQVNMRLKLIEESRNLLAQIEKQMRSPPDAT
jgi:hypothetical protein